MKLYAFDNSDLMEVKQIYTDKENIIVEGTIMGAMPIRAIVKPAEVRRAIAMMGPSTLLHAVLMLFRGTR